MDDWLRLSEQEMDDWRRHVDWKIAHRRMLVREAISRGYSYTDPDDWKTFEIQDAACAVLAVLAYVVLALVSQ